MSQVKRVNNESDAALLHVVLSHRRALQILVEPIHDVLQPFDAMPRLEQRLSTLADIDGWRFTKRQYRQPSAKSANIQTSRESRGGKQRSGEVGV